MPRKSHMSIFVVIICFHTLTYIHISLYLYEDLSISSGYPYRLTSVYIINNIQ